jgi:hypothetical protein
MSWVAVGTTAVGVVGGMMSDKGGSQQNGGAGTTTKEPWAAAQPWITNQLASGQALQNQYAANPFSPQQQTAYNNSYAQSDYMRNLVPSLLGQMSNQPVGYDPSNPSAKSSAWDWNALLGEGSPNLNQQSMADAQARADAAAAANKTQGRTGEFTQFNATPGSPESYWGAWLGNGNMLTDGGAGVRANFASALGDAGGAGFGEFQYGSAMPEKGTKAYRDMQEYFQYGGNDPYNLYGRAPVYEAPQNQNQNAGGA